MMFIPSSAGGGWQCSKAWRQLTRAPSELRSTPSSTVPIHFSPGPVWISLLPLGLPAHKYPKSPLETTYWKAITKKQSASYFAQELPPSCSCQSYSSKHRTRQVFCCMAEPFSHLSFLNNAWRCLKLHSRFHHKTFCLLASHHSSVQSSTTLFNSEIPERAQRKTWTLLLLLLFLLLLLLLSSSF